MERIGVIRIFDENIITSGSLDSSINNIDLRMK